MNAPASVALAPANFVIVLLKLVTATNPVEPPMLDVVKLGSNTTAVDTDNVNVPVCVLAPNLILLPDVVCVDCAD